MYIVVKSDLKPVSKLHDISKYADDITLLVPAQTDVGRAGEFQHVKQWAMSNRFTINFDKTKEIVLRKPKARCFHLPVAIDDIEQIKSVKLLDEIVPSNFNMDQNVSFFLTQCSQRLYILKMLKGLGFNYVQLNTVTTAMIVSRLKYALPAWDGFMTNELINRIDAFLRRIKRG